MLIIKKIKTKYLIMRNPIKAAINMGVDIGERCRLMTFPDSAQSRIWSASEIM